MSIFDGGSFGPIGGAAGPAYSGGSPVFQIAASDDSSVLDGQPFWNSGASAGGSISQNLIVILVIIIVAVLGGGAFLLAKK